MKYRTIKVQRNYEHIKLKYMKYIKICEFKWQKIPHQSLLQDAGTPIIPKNYDHIVFPVVSKHLVTKSSLSKNCSKLK